MRNVYYIEYTDSAIIKTRFNINKASKIRSKIRRVVNEEIHKYSLSCKRLLGATREEFGLFFSSTLKAGEVSQCENHPISIEFKDGKYIYVTFVHPNKQLIEIVNGKIIDLLAAL